MNASLANRNLARGGSALLLDVIAPTQKLVHELRASTVYIWDHYIDLRGVQLENASLKERIERLELANSQLSEFESENKRLKSILGYKSDSAVSGVTASVVGRDPSNWAHTVTIDRGSADGITPGLAVVDGHAVVGQTTVVSDHSSKVLLLTDNTSAIDVILQESRAPGIVEGKLSSTLELEYVLRDYFVRPGERVIASGLDGVFPKGVIVGTVSDVREKRTRLFHEIKLKPAVDTKRLETVLVLTSLPETDNTAENTENSAAQSASE